MLTPEDVTSREFLVSLRGYDRDQVRTFQHEVAEVVADLRERVTQLETELDRLRAAGDDSSSAVPSGQQAEPAAMFAEIGAETQRILQAAQEAAEQLRRRARSDSDRELQAARHRAATEVAEGERRREKIEAIIAQLEQARDALIGDLRGVGRTVERV
ncbi:MAG: DivIVA domain-containing protein, partial [Egibacteraceae bacterium]